MTTNFQTLVLVALERAKWARAVPLVIVLFGVSSLAMFAQASEAPNNTSAGVHKLFESGNEKFRDALEIVKADRSAAEAKFREAAGAWREAARIGGIHNVKLETNIANASLLAGDVPGAILAYRRALKIDPADRDVLAGLAAARRSAGTEALALGQTLSKKGEPGRIGGVRGAAESIRALVRDSIEWGARMVSLRVLLGAAIVCYIALFLALALRVSGKLRVPNAALALLFAFLLLASAPLITNEVRASGREEAVVIQPNVIARNGPAELYDAAFQEPLRAGLEVTVVESRGSWTKIRLRDGREAWLRGDALAIV